MSRWDRKIFYQHLGSQSRRNLAQNSSAKSSAGVAKAAPLCINLNEHEAVLGPLAGAYASFAILQPVITVELLDKEYHISARFNLQTNVHHEEADDESDSLHTWFMDSIRLRYESIVDDEQCIGQPGPEPEAAFSVTSTSGSSDSTDIGATIGTPTASSGNIKVGMVSNTNVTVQQKMKSWILSSERLTDSNPLNEQIPLRPKGAWAKLKATVFSRKVQATEAPAGWEWYWQGTQETTNLISIDQTRTVTRHVVLTRILQYNEYQNATQMEQIDYLCFFFSIKINARELGHSFRAKLLHRTQYDAKSNRGQRMNPPFMGYFTLSGGCRDCKPISLPQTETRAIGPMLIAARKQYANDLDGLQHAKLNNMQDGKSKPAKSSEVGHPSTKSNFLRVGGDDSASDRSDISTLTNAHGFNVVNWDNKTNRYT